MKLFWKRRKPAAPAARCSSADIERAKRLLREAYRRETEQIAENAPPRLIPDCLRAVRIEFERGTGRHGWAPPLAWASAAAVVLWMASFLVWQTAEDPAPTEVGSRTAISLPPTAHTDATPPRSVTWPCYATFLAKPQPPERPEPPPRPLATVEVPPLPVLTVPPRPVVQLAFDIPPRPKTTAPPRPVVNVSPLPIVRVAPSET